jgi:hypothetical protein
MKKFWRGFRKETDKAARDDVARVKADQLAKLRLLLEVGGHEAESEYVQFLKDWKPEISKEELKERIKQYHDAVSARQLRDRESR